MVNLVNLWERLWVKNQLEKLRQAETVFPSNLSERCLNNNKDKDKVKNNSKNNNNKGNNKNKN